KQLNIIGKWLKIGKVGKVLICGMKGVGKTALLEQLIYGNVNMDTVRQLLNNCLNDCLIVLNFFAKEIHPTIEDIYVASVDTGRGTRETLRIYSMIQRQDIDKKEKKEVPIIVLANMRARRKDTPPSPTQQQQQNNQIDPVEHILNRANSWCSRERIKHYTVNAMERPSLYEPFINLCARLHPPQTKSSFPQLRQVMQKTQKADA
ncbi:hypothetical protein DOY81_014899, partial [Sarcophaga bullata]